MRFTDTSLKFFFIFTFLLLLSFPIKAIEYGGLGGKPAYPDPGNERSKSIFIYNLENGDSKDDGVLVVNNTQETKTVIVYSTDSQKSSDGSFACEQYTDEKNHVGKWIDLEKEITLEPSTNEIVPFKITVPDNASVGEENGCIMIQEKKVSSVESGVSLSFRTGLRVAVTVPGEEIRKLEIDTFEYSIEGDGVIKAKFSVENKGNVSIDSHIKTTFTSILGQQVYNIDNQYPILKGETSTYNFEINKPFWGGFFTLTGAVEYDENVTAEIGKDSSTPRKVLYTDSFTIFIFPELGALLIELILLSIILFSLFLIIKRIKTNKDIQRTWVQYIVKENENINTLANKYNISWKLLAKVNNLAAPYQITKGDVIKIPNK